MIALRGVFVAPVAVCGLIAGVRDRGGGRCGEAAIWSGAGAGTCGLWRRGGEAARVWRRRFLVLGGRPSGGSAGVVGLAGVVGVQDALVADGQQAGDPQGERGQARQAAPAAGDAGGGGVLDGGEGALGAGAPGVGAPVRWGRVVVFLPGLGRDLRAGR